MPKMESNAPYDDVYRTMYVECDELVLPLLNEAFHEHYIGREKILRRGMSILTPAQAARRKSASRTRF